MRRSLCQVQTTVREQRSDGKCRGPGRVQRGWLPAYTNLPVLSTEAPFPESLDSSISLASTCLVWMILLASNWAKEPKAELVTQRAESWSPKLWQDCYLTRSDSPEKTSPGTQECPVNWHICVKSQSCTFRGSTTFSKLPKPDPCRQDIRPVLLHSSCIGSLSGKWGGLLVIYHYFPFLFLILRKTSAISIAA
jgi:hypothetical protein